MAPDLSDAMTQTGIPYLFMRGGTSRGPYFNRADLPEDLDTLAEVLIAAVGAGHPGNIDGVGGGSAVTTKVAMLSPSDHPEADVDYFFAQVAVEERLVDFKPSCGNILIGVGPAAIEMGIVAPTGDVTDVRIHAVNTGARVVSRVQTPGGQVAYGGETSIDGVPGTAAPIDVQFMDTVGGVTGAMFPTGNRKDRFGGIDVSCIDVAMPMMIARAEDFGVTGTESAADLDANTELFAAMEAVRLEAGAAMGLGDVTKSVTPKIGLIAPAQNGGAATVRYFMPWKCHPTLAVTGSQCLAACLLTPGTVGEGIFETEGQTAPLPVDLEHPSGTLRVVVDFDRNGSEITLKSAGLIRTARKIASGQIFVPGHIWTQG